MIVKILKVLGVFVVAMGLGFAVMYFDFVKPPEIVRKIPVVGSLLVENKQKDNSTDKGKQSETQQQKYDRLIKEMKAEIDIAKNISSKLENENVELLAEIAALEKEIDILKTAQVATESEAARLKKLAGYYGNMKAKQAAAIMSELDDTTVIRILMQMEMNATAGILGEMEPQQAARITQKMASEKGGE